MGLEIKKQSQEASQALIRRFTKGIRESGILLRARKQQFRTKPKSRQAKKRTALRREELRKEYERLKKLSKPR